MALHGYVVSEEKSVLPLVLIVDKKGIFGSDIVKKIHEDITTVLATAKEETSKGQLLAIPYTKTIPEIPEGNYTHMFFVWDGRSETLRVLEPILEKASLDKAQFLFITDYHCFTPKLGTYIRQQYTRASTLLTGDVFGRDAYESIVTKFFHEAQKHGAITLENVGLKHVYPVLFADVLEEIVRIGFSTEKGKVFIGCQKYGMTELSLVHALQKVNPLLKIDFKKEDRVSSSLPEGKHLFDTSYDVVRKLQDCYTDLLASKKERNIFGKGGFFFSPLVVRKEKKSQQRKKRIWVMGIIFTLFVLLSPILFTLFYTGLGALVLYAAGNAVKTGSYSEAVNFSETSMRLFTVAESSEAFSTKEMQIIFLGAFVDKLTQTIQTGNLFSILLGDSAKVIQNFTLVANGTSVSPMADFLSGVNTIKNALVTLQLPTTKGDIDGISLSTVAQQLQPLGSILDISPTLFGFPTKKTYAVLFQNNMELRPGGGFIGSYALISIEQGRITDFTIHDVYDADGQLRGHIEPPYVVRRYIPEQHWFLRDSNFDVDFSKDAANAAYFLQQETAQKVDGVIGIDITFVKDILAGIGSVYVPEYNQTVTADNIFFLTESHAEKNTFAGSTQKKDFLRSLLSAMQTKVMSSHGFSPKALVPLLMALKTKDVVFGFSNPLTQDVFTVNGLSSSLWDGRKTDEKTIQDISGINEANIGVNKANYFVTRAVNQAITISKTGSIAGKLAITYRNDSVVGVWPGGDYKNYLRIILPQGALLKTIVLNGIQQALVPAITNFSQYEAKDFVAPKGLEVDSATEEGKQLFGFVITIPAEATTQVDITYTLSQKVDTTIPVVTYNGWLVKQSGVDAYPYHFSLNMPNNFTLLQKPNWIQTDGSTISFTTPFKEDMQFALDFTQK